MDEDRAGLLPSDLPVVLTSSTARMMELTVWYAAIYPDD
jgi:hypothetical protein